MSSVAVNLDTDYSSRTKASAIYQQHYSPRLNAILLGPPGSGKGTVAQKTTETYGLCHLSTGDMLRKEAESGSELGKHISKLMKEGTLVDDETVLKLIESNIGKSECSLGFLLDGFPRNITQAEKLDKLLKSNNNRLDSVIEMKIDDSLLVKRVTGRLTHPKSGRIYHEQFSPPKKPMKDDITGEQLVKRIDDDVETLKKRLNTFHKYTMPLVDYYTKKKILTTIDASKSPDQVFLEVRSILDKAKSKDRVFFI